MNTSSTTPVFVLDDVTKSYARSAAGPAALRNVSLSGYPGEFIVLLGPSGSGKTTLLSVLAGLLEPTAGRVELFGGTVAGMSPRELQRLRAARMGFVFQNFQLFDTLRVEENVALVQLFNGSGRGEARARSRELLAALGIEHLATKYPDQISQGEKQRVAIARALSNNPALLLADEPTASLESRQGREVIRILSDAARRTGCCVVCATHDLRVTESAGRIVELADGGRRTMVEDRR